MKEGPSPPEKAWISGATPDFKKPSKPSGARYDLSGHCEALRNLELFSRLINSLLFSDGQRVRCALCGSGIEQIDGVNWRSRGKSTYEDDKPGSEKSDRPLAFHKGAEGSSEPL